MKAPELLAAVLESSADAVTVLTLGPLTNLAELITTHPDAVDKIDLVFTMGGALETPGNVAGSGAGFDASEAVEWNFFIDPEAARVVLESRALVTLVSLDATLDVPFTPELGLMLGEARSTPAGGVIADMIDQNPALFGPGFFMWDPLAAALVADETLAMFEMHRVEVVVGGGPDAGSIITNVDGGARIRVTVSALRDRFEQLFLETLAAEAPMASDDIDTTDAVEVYGDVVWEFSFEGEFDNGVTGLHSRAAIDGGVVYFGGSNGTVYALDLVTGVEIWSLPVIDDLGVIDFIALSDAAVFFRDRDAEVGDDIVAVARNTGTELWRFLPPEGETQLRNPAFADGVVYTGTSDFLYALDAETGEELWRFRPEGGAPGPALRPPSSMGWPISERRPRCCTR